MMDTFTSATHTPDSERTRPTSEQVQKFITKAVDRVVTKMGLVIDDADLRAEAQDMAAMRAAMMIELVYYPEQIDADRSPYKEFKELWDNAMGSSDTSGGSGDTESDVVGSTDNRPSFGFPSPDLVPVDSVEWHPQYGWLPVARSVPDNGLDLGEA